MSRFFLDTPSSHSQSLAASPSPNPTANTNTTSYFPSQTYNDYSDDDDLPYPAPLPRSEFLAPDFNAATYLSTLHNRHQTLEDLRQELRSLSQNLNKELLDLVNGNYQDFLSLGSSLRGGDEKVEEVSVGLLGFRKQVEGIKSTVRERREEVDELLQERVQLRQDISLGQQLLDVDARIEELEAGLVVTQAPNRANGDTGTESDSEDYSDEEEDEDEGTALPKLRRHVQQYICIKQLAEQIGPAHPFLVAKEARVAQVKNTLLLDISAALKQSKSMGEPGKGSLVKVLGLYRDMDEVGEATRALKALISQR